MGDSRVDSLPDDLDAAKKELANLENSDWHTVELINSRYYWLRGYIAGYEECQEEWWMDVQVRQEYDE